MPDPRAAGPTRPWGAVADYARELQLAVLVAEIEQENATQPVPTATDLAVAEWNSPEQQQIRAEAFAKYGVEEIG